MPSKVFWGLALVVSAFTAFLLLTVNVGTSNMGGTMGTMVLQPDATQEDIETTISVLRMAGAAWIGLVIFSFGKFLSKFKQSHQH